MSGTESLFYGIVVDFDEDDIDLDELGFNAIGDQMGGEKRFVQSMPLSVTSPSIFNTRSTTGLDFGPNFNSNPTRIALNYELGVRHAKHLTSNSLNQRMAERGKHFSYSTHNSNVKHFKQKSSNFVQKRQNNFSSKYPMDDIQEDCAESYDTYRSHQINSNVINKNDFNKMGKVVKVDHSSGHQINGGLKSKDRPQKCVKSVSKPIVHQSNDGSNIDIKSSKLSVSPSCKAIPKIDYPNDDNPIIDTDSGKGNKNCDKKPNNKTAIIEQIRADNLDLSKSPEKLSTNYKRSVNLVTLSAQQELKRYESQRFCETVSLITIIFGLLLVTITPFLLIPIWVIPNQYSGLIRNFLWVSMLTTIVLLTLAALTGNIYWYYDERSQKWKWFYHCGKGPHNHYWGTHFHKQSILKRLVKSKSNHKNTINV